jgi:5-methylphenazine-1-carboxylate 1-monooxygenase
MHAELGAADRSSSPLRGALLVKNHPVVIAGAGIGGLATALTLHQIGVESLVLESVREMRPLGVGLNLQPNAVRLGARVSGYRRCSDDRVMVRSTHPDGFSSEMEGKLLIGADGIHSPVRAQMHPGQPPIHWGGKMMWRGVTRARPIRTGASFIGLGTHEHRFVFYPISHSNTHTGLALINWIAEVTLDDADDRRLSGWFRQVPCSAFLHHFQDWRWEWLDVPALIRGAESAFENPMIDRDPVATWVDGPVALLGDAAHAMYPTGSNGASQAIVDARILGAAMCEHGVGPEALASYDARLCGPISKLILRNRGEGPFGLLNIVDERCGGAFDNIDDVIPPPERVAFMADYRAAAGFAIETLNAAPPVIPRGAQAATERNRAPLSR